MVAISANERVQREKDNTTQETQRADAAEAELETLRAENSARANQQTVIARTDLENPDQEPRPDPGIFDIFDGRKLSLPPGIHEELQARNVHAEFQLDDKAGSLKEYIRPGSPWEVFKDAMGKEVRVPASPSNASQMLVLLTVSMEWYEASIEHVASQMEKRRRGTLHLKPNEYVGKESTVFNG